MLAFIKKYYYQFFQRGKENCHLTFLVKEKLLFLMMSIKINFQLLHKLQGVARSNDIFNIIHIQTIIENSWKSFFFLTVGNLCYV